MNRVSFIARLASVILLLSTAGCFRPAGESIEPTTGILQLPESSSEQSTQPASGTLQSSDLENLNITITPVAPENAEATLSIVTLSQDTPQAPATRATGFPTLIAVTATPQFITPGSPLGPVTPDTATPTLDGPLTSTPSGLITPTSLPGTEEDDCTYIVQPNDNLYQIAINGGFTVEEITAANPDLVGDPPILQVGQTLQLPNCEDGSTSAVPPTAGSIPATSAITAPAGGEVYVVQSGDTLYTISLQYGITVQEIIDANTLPDPDRLDIGQEIIIPPAS